MMMKIKVGDTWRVTDGVIEIRYSYENEEVAKALLGDESRRDTWIDNYGKLENKKVAVILVYFKDRQDELIITDDSIYILNNEGRTCEHVGVYN